ncbi:hypothetical protein GCM10010317_068430 [Streptomyces mirabilis]|nr:hypothetical protein GCM10010317_068430 [Streptomyces mirabilis]
MDPHPPHPSTHGWSPHAPNRVSRPRRPYPSRAWGLRPQTPLVGLNGLVLKRRAGCKTRTNASHGRREQHAQPHSPAPGPPTEGAVAVRRKPVAYARIEQRLPCPTHV